MSQSISHLIIIESPGKYQAIQNALAQTPIGNNAYIQATKGAIYNLPTDQLGIAHDTLLPNEYHATHPHLLQQIVSLMRRTHTLWVATDPDAEGELIATHLFALAAQQQVPHIHRVRFPSLDGPTLIHAFQYPDDQPNHHLAKTALVRRSVDRLFGYLYSDRQMPNKAGLVGRVQTRMLKHLFDSPPLAAELQGQTKSGWQVFGQAVAGNQHLLKKLKHLLEQDPLDALPKHRQTIDIPPPPPLGYIDLLIESQRQLGFTPHRTEKLTQTLYDTGNLTYFRTDNTTLGDAASAEVQQLAVDNHVRTRNIVPDAQTPNRQAHEAMHPTHFLDIHQEPEDLPDQDAVLWLIAKRLVTAASHHHVATRTSPEPDALHAWLESHNIDAKQLFALNIYKDDRPNNGWTRICRTPQHGLVYRDYPLDEIFLTHMKAHAIGRPSTYTAHLNNIKRRYWLSEDGSLTLAAHDAMVYAKENAGFLLRSDDPVDKAEQREEPNPISAETLITDLLKQYSLSPSQIGAKIHEAYPDTADREFTS